MSNDKHTRITEDLEKRIRAGGFGEKLPPVRALCKEYAVALQTMTKALRPLRDNGLLVPGPGGTRILPRGRGASGIGVVTAFALGATAVLDPAQDPMLIALRKAAEADGVTLVLMWTSDIRIFKRKNFWKSSSTDGYIFLYSSFYPLLKEHLQESDIPFVAANWLPDDCGVHWIDWDSRKQFFDVVKQLRERGIRRIGYAPTVRRYKCGANFHYDLWRDICDCYQLENMSGSLADFECEPVKMLARWLARGREHFPEIILVFNTKTAPLLDFLEKEGLDAKILSTAVSEGQRDARCLYLPGLDYTFFGQKIWELFRDVYNKRAGKPHPHLVFKPYPLDDIL